MIQQADPPGMWELREIIDEGLLTSLFIPDPSLAGGKTGAAVFFALLSERTRRRNHAEFAETLIGKICEDLTVHTPVGFAYGLCGIGWSVEFLRHRGFLDIDTDELLEEIDRMVMERDVRRIEDLSLECGLKGTAAYVAARLEAPRNPDGPLPFDEVFLSELRERLDKEGMDSTLKSYGVDDIWLEYLGSLDGSDPALPFWQRGSLLIERMDSEIQPSSELSAGTVKEDALKDLVMIFTAECFGLHYGIGTYMQTLLGAIDRDACLVMTVNLASGQFRIQEQDGTTMLDIPDRSMSGNHEQMQESYALSCFHLIAEYMPEARNVICHFNLYGYTHLIRLLRERLSASVIFTVHFTHCGVDMKGDYARLRYLEDHPDEVMSETEKDVLESFHREKETLEICDAIIAPSRHTVGYLTGLYGIPQEKIMVIPHALRKLPTPAEDRDFLRKEFGVDEKDVVLLYVGRIRCDKGVFDLMESVKPLMAERSEIRLVIAGTGEIEKAFRLVAPYRTRIIFTGFLQSDELAAMYRLADIGVVPSHYEEFGYVALEMAASGLTTVVSDGGALPETTEGFDGIHRFAAADTASLTDAISRAIEDLDGRKAAHRIPKDTEASLRNFGNAMNALYRSAATGTFNEQH